MIRTFYAFALGILLTGAQTALAQVEDPQLSMYMYNPVYYNPAAAGSEGVSRLQLVQRTQYVGYTPTITSDGGAQSTQLVSFNMPLAGIKSGIGVYAFNDRIGPITNQTVQAAYAYRMALKSGTLALGVQAGFYSKGYDYGQLRPGDPVDPLIPTGQISQARPDIGAGVYYNTTDYWIGVSMKHINQASYVLGTDRSVNPLSRNAFLTAGYRLGIGYDIDVQPSVLVQYSTMGGVTSSNVALNLVGTYANRIWAGVGYRWQDALTATAGINLLRDNSLRLGGAFDFVVGGTQIKSATSYEVLLSYAFPALDSRKKPIVRTPRFRY
jgi:type IX secretion system PorP/SprF family membrane protein